MPEELNPTQGSLLGFLSDGAKTGWDLLQEVQRGLARFWNVTPSHVYRELRTLEERGLIVAGKPGSRDRRPYSLTAAGKRAFRAWINEEPGPEQIRFPLLVKLWFGRHLDAAALTEFVEHSRKDHEQRLQMYQSVHPVDEHTAAVISFGISYERAILDWLETIPEPGGSESVLLRAASSENDDRSGAIE